MSILNNKKFQPYLIGIVVLLWVLVGYRVYDYTKPENETAAIQLNTRKLAVKASTEIWEPKFDYKDPFLKNVKRPRAKSTVQQAEKPIAEVIKEEEILPPTLSIAVQYNGFIENGHNDERVGIFVINQQTHLKKEGENLNGILIKKIETNHVTLEEEGNEFEVILTN